MRMKPMYYLLVALYPLCAACGTSTAPVAPEVFTLEEAADSIPISFGQTISVGNILVTFVDVPDDSRCPSRVLCVWAGDATVSVGAALACTRSTPRCLVPELQIDLHTNAEPRAGRYGGIEIQLLALEPYPEVPGSIKKSKYQAWLRIRAVST